jgi:hypothetical protein
MLLTEANEGKIESFQIDLLQNIEPKKSEDEKQSLV